MFLLQKNRVVYAFILSLGLVAFTSSRTAEQAFKQFCDQESQLQFRQERLSVDAMPANTRLAGCDLETNFKSQKIIWDKISQLYHHIKKRNEIAKRACWYGYFVPESFLKYHQYTKTLGVIAAGLRRLPHMPKNSAALYFRIDNLFYSSSELALQGTILPETIQQDKDFGEFLAQLAQEEVSESGIIAHIVLMAEVMSRRKQLLTLKELHEQIIAIMNGAGLPLEYHENPDHSPVEGVLKI